MERSSCTSSSRRATWHGSCEGCTRTGGGSGRRAAARTSEATSRAAKCCRRHTCMLLHARGASHACGAPHAAHACGAGGACSAPAKQANGDAAMCARAGACARAFGLLDVGAELFIRDCDGRLTARMKKHEGTARHAWACSCASRKRTGARGEGKDGEREAHNLAARRLSAVLQTEQPRLHSHNHCPFLVIVMAPRQLKFDSSRDLAVVVALLNVSKEEEEEDVGLSQNAQC